MARKLRYVPPGSVVEVTVRTVQGRLLLKPTPAITEVILGVLGRAQRRYPIRLFAFCWLSNHVHLLVAPDDAQQLASFCGYLLGNVARKVGKRVGWREKLWGRRYASIVVSDEDRAQIARLRYTLENGVKEKLVDSPMDWPGATAAVALADGSMAVEGVWLDETRAFRMRLKGKAPTREDIAEPEVVQLSQLPCWSHLPPEIYRERIQQLVADIEREAEERHAENGTKAMGVEKLRRQDPHDKPRSSERSPAPFFHCASKEAFWLLWNAYHTFYAAHRAAAEDLRNGLAARFPGGSFPPSAPFIFDSG